MAQLVHPIDLGDVVLRRFRRDDLSDLGELYGTDAVTRYLYWDVRDERQAAHMLDQRLQRPVEVTDRNVLPVAVEDARQRCLIGDFMLRWTVNEHRQGEMGGALSPAFQGRGISLLVYGELLRLGFANFALHRIVGRCDARNGPSIRSLEKAGLHQEANFFENEYVKGEWTDEVVLAIRRAQWSDGRTRKSQPVHQYPRGVAP